MKGIVADRPAVVREAKKMISARGLEDRCRAVECDFFKEIPPGSDACLLSNILHDWPDEQCGIILENCCRAMKEKSRLLIVERVVPPGNDLCIAKLPDLEMMVMTGRRERSQEEFETLLTSSGFRYSGTMVTKEGVWIIEAVRPAAGKSGV